MKLQKDLHRPLRSPKFAGLGHFTLLFVSRGRLRESAKIAADARAQPLFHSLSLLCCCRYMVCFLYYVVPHGFIRKNNGATKPLIALPKCNQRLIFSRRKQSIRNMEYCPRHMKTMSIGISAAIETKWKHDKYNTSNVNERLVSKRYNKNKHETNLSNVTREN